MNIVHLPCNKRRGALLVMLTFLMLSFMLLAALSIEIAQVHLARTELRTATDAAARAAAENLSRTFDPVQACQRGIEVAALNRVGGQPLLLKENHFEFGHAVQEKATGRFRFFPDRLPQNSVRVTSAGTSTNGKTRVPFLLGSILGENFFEVRGSATATYLEGDVVLTLSTIMAE